MSKARGKFEVWTQHWLGYRPRKCGSYLSREEADDAAERLNCSPSGQWFRYSVVVRDDLPFPQKDLKCY